MQRDEDQPVTPVNGARALDGDVVSFQHELCFSSTHGLGAAASVAEWFEVSPRACFLVEAQGLIQVSNREARRLLAAGSGVSARAGVLRFHCEASQRLLAAALHAVCHGHCDRVRRVLRADDAEWRMIWVVPTLDRARAFVTLSQSEDDVDVVEQLSGAFGFTRTEANVMENILAGDAPKQVGTHLDISTNTVRTHLRSISSKMNVRGLSQAIRLASRLTTP